jgi:hypothetical protein
MPGTFFFSLFSFFYYHFYFFFTNGYIFCYSKTTAAKNKEVAALAGGNKPLPRLVFLFIRLLFLIKTIFNRSERILDEEGTSVAPPQRLRLQAATPDVPTHSGTRQRVENRIPEAHNESGSDDSDDSEDESENEASNDDDGNRQSKKKTGYVPPAPFFYFFLRQRLSRRCFYFILILFYFITVYPSSRGSYPSYDDAYPFFMGLALVPVALALSRRPTPLYEGFFRSNLRHRRFPHAP